MTRYRVSWRAASRTSAASLGTAARPIEANVQNKGAFAIECYSEKRAVEHVVPHGIHLHSSRDQCGPPRERDAHTEEAKSDWRNERARRRRQSKRPSPGQPL